MFEPARRDKHVQAHVDTGRVELAPRKRGGGGAQPGSSEFIALNSAWEAAQRTYTAQTRTAAIDAANTFADDFAAHPKATAKITGQFDTLLAFFDSPEEHCKHLRTTNAIQGRPSPRCGYASAPPRAPEAAPPAWRWPTS